MQFGTLICVIIIVQSVVYILIKGERIKLRARKLKSVANLKGELYDRVKLNSDIKGFINRVNREPNIIIPRISPRQRARTSKLNTIRHKQRRRTKEVRFIPTRRKEGGNMPKHPFYNRRNRFGKRFRGLSRKQKTHHFPVKQHRNIITGRDKSFDHTNYEQNRDNKIIRQPIKTIKTAGHTIKLSRSPNNDMKTGQFNENNRSDNKLHTPRIDRPLILINDSPSVATKRQIGEKLKTFQTLADKSSIPEAKPQQSTNVFDRSGTKSHKFAIPSPIPFRMFIPPLKSYRYQGRKKKQHSHKLRQTMTKSINPKSIPLISFAPTNTVKQRKPKTISTASNDVTEQKDTSSLLTLLNSRRPKTRNKIDEHMIRKHLLTLDSMRDGDTNKTRVLIKQMQYVKTIAEFNIKKEVLKLLVKDIVEKSGIMSNDTRRADFRTLVKLINIINKITAEFADPTLSVTDQTNTKLVVKPVQEPIGGNSAYWTHLTGGIADMVCNLCKGQAVDDCVIRYCSDDKQVNETNGDKSKSADK